MNKASLVSFAAAIPMVLVTTQASADVANCTYRLRVKADRIAGGGSVRSVSLPNGTVIVKGRAKGRGSWIRLSTSDKEAAKISASEVAGRCFRDAARRNSGNPVACTRRIRLGGSRWATVKNWNIPNMREVALRLVCQAAGGGQKQLRGVQVYAERAKGGKRCGIDGRRYWTVLRTAVSCGRAAGPATFTSSGTRPSGWHNISATGLRARIKRVCKNQYNLPAFKTVKFEVRQRDGHIRAFFICNPR
jgi:hypothetical protein